MWSKNNLVYKVNPKNGGTKGTRTLHRNLLLLVNDLPVETPDPGKPGKQKQNRQKDRETLSKELTYHGGEETDSDEEDSGRYWLRIPSSWAEPRKGGTYLSSPEPSQENPVVGVAPPAPAREEQDQIQMSPPRGDIQGSNQSRDGSVHFTISLPRSEENDEIESLRMSGARDSLAEEDPVMLRRSARERKPKSMFTYETLGQPSTQPLTKLDSVTAHTLPYLPVWGTPYTVPHSFQITPYPDITTFTPFTSAMLVY